MSTAELQLLRGGLEDLREHISHDCLNKCRGLVEGQPCELQHQMSELVRAIDSICHVENILDHMVMELS